MKARLLILACAAAMLSPTVGSPQPRGGPLGAGGLGQQDEARRGVQQGNLPLTQVIATIRRMTPGQLLDAGLETGADGRAVYRVRWAATDGRRIDYLVDARSGSILSAGGG